MNNKYYNIYKFKLNKKFSDPETENFNEFMKDCLHELKEDFIIKDDHYECNMVLKAYLLKYRYPIVLSVLMDWFKIEKADDLPIIEITRCVFPNIQPESHISMVYKLNLSKCVIRSVRERIADDNIIYYDVRFTAHGDLILPARE